MSKNNNLHSAKNAKNNEFYTKLEDIEKEIVNYVPFFEGKVVYCNCDDYRISNFTKYFKNNFEHLKLKKLICTNYDNGEGAWKYEYDGKNETIAKLESNGSFDSEECVNLLNKSDIVVTNPAFSLFRSYVKQLMNNNKYFLIIGNMNAITYKEIFHYIKNNELWLGMNWVKEFIQSNGEIKKFGNICWFTNIPHNKNQKPLVLTKIYNPIDYPKYENYDAIEVSKVKDIPIDYKGVMGVPISFLNKYCNSQFEIVWTTDRGGDGKLEHLKNNDWKGLWDSAFVNGSKVYKRIFIKKVS